MDKWQAQYSFWSSFGVPAYEENSVPSDAVLPYISYQAVSGATFGSSANASASVWTRNTSWADADELADLISATLRDGGKQIHYNGGTLWITAQEIFAASMGDPEDDSVKRKLLSVTINFL